MRIEYTNDENFTIYLYDKNKLKTIDEIKKDPEKFFKSIFLILKDKYKFYLEGLYKLELFPCKYYGIVIEISKEEDEFYEKYIDGVDLKIKINQEENVLYEIDDIFLECLKEHIIFKSNDKFYLMFDKQPTNKEILSIIEHSKIIYGNECKKIINPHNLFTNN